MKTSDPLVIPWRGHQVRVRHDDPRLGPYTPSGARIRSAIELASDVEGLRRRWCGCRGIWLAASRGHHVGSLSAGTGHDADRWRIGEAASKVRHPGEIVPTRMSGQAVGRLDAMVKAGW